MNLSKYFVDRPVLAGVLSLLIVLSGLLAVGLLPIAEFPDVVPPAVVVRAQFPGATPQVVADTVAGPIEEQINGIEGMLYMSSQASTDGLMTLTVTFALGTNPDLAQQLVQNRVARALPRLPVEVQKLGVSAVKSTADLPMVVHLLSPNQRYDTNYLHNYAVLNVKDRLARVPGVAEVTLMGGGDYAMRVWIDPNKAAARGLAANDIVRAIRQQNVDVAAGSIGASPSAPGVDYQLSVNAHGRLSTEAEFGDIVLRIAPGGAATYLRDVARIELGASDYSLRSLLDNKPAAALSIYQAPGANALELGTRVEQVMRELKTRMPQDVEYQIVYDTTKYVRASIKAVVITLLEAVLLVVLVVIIFLQTWRASLIPLLAVPVSVIGTFAVMLGLGFSINALSLFGLVLSIGIVVDDAIVVVESVERNIALGMSPREATYAAMREVAGPIVAIAFTLVAVFVPLAFISGLSGQFYKQFALTLAISTVISAFNSLTLSPALCALLLKPHQDKHDAFQRGIDKLFGRFFDAFNRLFRRGSDAYVGGVASCLSRKGATLLVYGALIAVTYGMFQIVPGGFIPTQDKQYLITFAQLPDAASLDRTENVIRKMSDIAMAQPGVMSAVAFPGLSPMGPTNSSNAGIVFAILTPFEQRTSADLSAAAIADQLRKKYGAIQEAYVGVFPPPPVSGMGTIGGFKLQLQDRGSLGNEALNKALGEFMAQANKAPELANLFSSYQVGVPQLSVTVDRVKAQQLGLALPDLFETLQIYLGSLYVNDFNRFGRTYQVRAQADAPFRASAQDIGLLKARNDQGEMVPLSSVMQLTHSQGPDRAMRYNAYPTADVNGAPAPGYGSSQAKASVEKIAAATLPNGIGFEWTELTYQQELTGDTLFVTLPLAVILVFLVLAAQYESVRLPLAVLLIVPMGLLSAITGVWLTKGENNIFTQIGLMVLVGLACKNAILIVEFARELELQGRSAMAAAIEAARLRLRPILMTSIAFVAGVVPLAISTGAGSEMRRAIGIAVLSGMTGVTIFGLLLTPVFFVALSKKPAPGRSAHTHGVGVERGPA